MGSLYARPSDIRQPTWTLTAGAAVSGWPVTRLGDLKPYEPFRADSGTCTARGTFGSATTLEAVAVICHTLAGETITITNGAGLSTTLVVPADTADGLSVCAWKDLRGVANPTSTTWDLAIAGAAADVAIGQVLLIETVRTLNVRWGLTLGTEYPIDEQRTEMDVPLIYEFGIRNRAFSAAMNKESDRAAIEALQASAHGRARKWWLVPDDTVNDCLYARFTSRTLDRLRAYPHVTRITIDVEEIGLGPALE